MAKEICPICKGEYGRTYEQHTGQQRHKDVVAEHVGRKPGASRAREAEAAALATAPAEGLDVERLRTDCTCSSGKYGGSHTANCKLRKQEQVTRIEAILRRPQAGREYDAMTTCGHSHYADGHCAEMICSNYFSRCRRHAPSGRPDERCTLAWDGIERRELIRRRKEHRHG